MNTYHLTIITPDGKLFDDQAVSLIAPGSEGSLGILAGHTEMVTRLGKGVLEIKTPQDQKYFAMDSGVMEVDTQSNVLVLADTALSAENRDLAFQRVKDWS